jgi:Uma2 family endonuclease
MSAVPKRRYTAREYLELERAAPYKSEFFNGQILPMHRHDNKVVDSRSCYHDVIQDNFLRHLHHALDGTGCRVQSGDQNVLIPASGQSSESDIVVRSGPAENVTVIIDILSPSTEGYERGAKCRFYRGITSLREYVLVAQDRQVIDSFTRQDDETWVVNWTDGPNAVFQFSSINASVRLAEVYEGVPFAEAADAG